MTYAATIAPPRIREAAPDDHRIAAYVAGHAEATPFHRPEWIAAAAAGTGQRARVLIAEVVGRGLVGVLPLVEIRSRLFGDVLAGSGFGVGGGILADDATTGEALAAAAVALAQARGCATVELRGGHLPVGWDVDGASHAGFARALAHDDDAELKAIPRKQRAEVRKALAGDLVVDVGRGAEQRAAHWRVYAESVRNLGTPVFPRRLFAEVLDRFGDDADILTVASAGRPVASVLSLYHRGTVLPFWGGGTAAARGLRANELMYFALMRHARAKGCTRFDFGRSKAGSGAWAFKKNWGFAPEPLRYARWQAAGGGERAANPLDPRYAARIAAWKRLPLPIANLIGPWLARGLG